MNFSKERKNEIFLYDTRVENLFISEYMSAAPGDYVKVYLYALMYAELARPLDNATIGRETGLAEEDVARAWDYWEKKGVVHRTYPSEEDHFRYEVQFVSLRELVYSHKRRHGAESGLAEGENTRMPNAYAADFSNETLQRMYQAIERVTGRLFDGKEPQTILSWITDYGADPAGIVEAYKYCGAVRKNTRTSYVGAVVREWAEKNVRTPEEIQAHLAETDRRHSQYKRVLRALGFARNATEEEQRLMNVWFDDMGFTVEEVLEACKKTSGISNPNINYVNSVLTAWHREKTGGREEPAAESGKNDWIHRRLAAYEALRARHEAELEARRETIYAAVPRIEEIEREMHRMTLDLSGFILGGGPSSSRVAQQKAALGALEEEKKALLQRAGYNPSDLEMEYTCSKCMDTGFLEDGSRCSCFTEEA